MRKLCPNLERDDALDTVLEVPIPEEMFSGGGGSRGSRFGCTSVKAWMRSHAADRSGAGEPCSMSRGELQLMLGVIGAPLIPLPVSHAKQSPSSVLCEQLKGDPIESSSAKYIVQQYIAASGGEWALNKVKSMYAMGKVRMTAAELNSSDADGSNNGGSGHRGGKKGGKGGAGGGGEIGGFVLWQKKPELWCLELVVSGCKISAGSDGKVAWRQTPWHQSHASRGPPRPLRRSLQGLDPMLTASLFADDSVCIGERSIEGEDCFVLKVEAEASSLRARNSSSVEIIRHTVWGYFSQRTGLLVQLEDSHLLQIKSSGHGSVFWETTMESRLGDYRAVDGVNIAHAGRTAVSLVRFGDSQDGNTRTRMEETWNIEEVDFNIWGLSMDCFLPPSDLREGKDGQDVAAVKPARPPPLRIPAVAVRVGPSQVAAVNLDESDSLIAR
ncbi:uncharacterized protein LOC100840558 [Brachypodium distachyon]|uniref:Uncharacterized protein n=1 Tax=Brachypodium distachyon TaxID=15368 RepID=I1H738_BRADI|nr:uncharacterized protein LOC100840558 [Brachypodium distachyon]KQK22407.1 hypothetical protein BRADI_1g67010v3 [Brachypodium distachyon]|eukprot:XP_003558267.1 uncharacterized protein LOC100840558 [Brachypodium distachyon]